MSDAMIVLDHMSWLVVIESCSGSLPYHVYGFSMMFLLLYFSGRAGFTLSSSFIKIQLLIQLFQSMSLK